MCLAAGAAVAGALLTAVPLVRAQAPAYPVKTVRLIASQSAGGGVDTVARVVALRLGDALGPIIAVAGRRLAVQQRGGGGAIGRTVAAMNVLLQFRAGAIAPVADAFPTSVKRGGHGVEALKRLGCCRVKDEIASRKKARLRAAFPFLLSGGLRLSRC